MRRNPKIHTCRNCIHFDRLNAPKDDLLNPLGLCAAGPPGGTSLMSGNGQMVTVAAWSEQPGACGVPMRANSGCDKHEPKAPTLLDASARQTN